MKVRSALVSLVAITVAYLGLLAWVDSRNGVFGRLPSLTLRQHSVAAVEPGVASEPR